MEEFTKKIDKAKKQIDAFSMTEERMTYRTLLRKLAIKDGYNMGQADYALKHLTVCEVFRYDEAEGKDWDDRADNKSLKELTI